MDGTVEKAQVIGAGSATRIVLVAGRISGGTVMTLRSMSLVVAAVALLGASAAEAKGRILFSGCVKQKVMKGALCSYVGNYALAADPRPDPMKGLAIAGNGMRNPVVTVCGGIGLTHVEWHYTKKMCPKPAKKD
jgi:hypothetical protein